MVPTGKSTNFKTSQPIAVPDASKTFGRASSGCGDHNKHIHFNKWNGADNTLLQQLQQGEFDAESAIVIKAIFPLSSVTSAKELESIKEDIARLFIDSGNGVKVKAFLFLIWSRQQPIDVGDEYSEILNLMIILAREHSIDLGKRCSVILNFLSDNTYLHGLEFKLSDHAGFELSVLNKLDLSGLDLTNVVMVGANLYKTILIGTNLHNGVMRNTCLYEANLKNANLSNAQMIDVDVRFADFSEAEMAGAVLRASDKSELDTTGTVFVGVKNYVVIDSCPESESDFDNSLFG